MKVKIPKKESPNEESYKWPKQAALYMFKPESGYVCSQCIMYNDKKCKLFPETEKISPDGSCNFFIHGHADKFEISQIGLLSKEMAGYEDPQGGFFCKNCEYFMDKTNDCQRVDKLSEGDTPGIIHPQACCNRWDSNKEK